MSYPGIEDYTGVYDGKNHTVKLVDIPNEIDDFTDLVWNSLNEYNKVSLFVRFIDIATGTYETRIMNKNQ